MAGPLTGARALASLVRYLSRLDPTGGASDLPQAVDALRARRRCRGLLIVLSDFLNVPRCEHAISAACAAGARVLCVQVLDPVDRAVGLSGNVRLRDSESGRLVDVKVDDAVRARYQRQFEEARARFEAFCRSRGQQYLLAPTGDHYLELACGALRAKAGVR